MTPNREGPRQQDQAPGPVRPGFEQAVVEANLALREELEERTAALDAAESRFRAIVGASQDGIVVVDRDGNVLFMNPAAAAILDRPPNELIGHPLGVPVSEDEPNLIEIVDRRGEIRIYQKRVVETEWHGATAHLMTLHDVTAIKSAELLLKEAIARLEEVNELKNEFVGMVVHDMKTPLTIITGFVHALRRNWDRFSDDQKKDLLARLDRRSSELDRMVSDTLQVAQIEASQFNYRVEPFELATMIERTTEAIRTVAREARIELVMPDALPLATGDQARYAQVLTNLLTNAVKFAADPAVIQVEVHLVGRMLRVTVADNGEGISQEEMPMLFKRFSRLRQHDNIEGSGLGLYICKRMVEDQKGRLWVESELGIGSKFSFTIPTA